MLRSMYSGISGMKVNQTKLDVIGNNIANASTTSFKASRARFCDMLSQSVTSAMAPSESTGGVNASQVGLGVKLASIDSIMTQGNLQSTGRALDVAIDQAGFFIISSGPEISADGTIQVSQEEGAHSIDDNSLATSNASLMYSRDGSFVLDRTGNLLTGDGYRVMGYSLTNDDNAIPATAVSSTAVSAAGMDFAFGPGSQLNGYKVVLGNVGPGTAASANIDKNNKNIVVNGDFSTDSLNVKQIETAISKSLSASGISQQIAVSGTPSVLSNLGSQKIAGGTDAESPTSVMTSGYTFKFAKGASLNGYKIEATDATHFKLINPSNVAEAFTAADTTEIATEINARVPGSVISPVTGSYSGTPGITNKIAGGVNTVAPAASQAMGVNINFTAGAELNGYKIQIGKITTGTKTAAEINQTAKIITINGDFANSGQVDAAEIETAINKELNAKGFSQNATVTGTVSSFSGTESQETMGGTSVQSLNTDGTVNFIDATGEIGAYDGSLKSLKIPDAVKMAGSGESVKITSYTISKNGVINGVLENGRVAALGQIAMANFKNPEGLTKNGGNIYNTSANSGDAIIKAGVGTTGDDNSLGYGEMMQGMLEMSNVDLAEQFTEMIVSTRAFQASGKAINTGDEILQDIINLKR